MKLSKRQKKYREYLASEDWTKLRSEALERDGGKCVICDSVEGLQVHHHRYPKNVKDSSLDDVETLCKVCHRLEHGYGRTRVEMVCDEIEIKYIRFQKRPPIELWQKIKQLGIQGDWDLKCFSDLMFQWIVHQLPFEKYGYTKNWWLDREVSDFWRNKAINVRNKIMERSHVR